MSATPERQRGWVVAGGARLAAETITPPGSGGPPRLVFLHDALGGIAQWRGVPAAVAARTGLPALVYERRGSGDSDQLEGPRPATYLRAEAEEVLPGVLAGCGVRDPILVGHSDGGTIALLFAARFPSVPRGLATVAAHVFVEEVTVAGIRAALPAWEAGPLRRGLERYHGAKAGALFRAWADTWLDPAYRDWSIVKELAAIRCPTLVVQGENDDYGTAAQVEAITGSIGPSARSVLLAGRGHMPHLEAPEELVELLAGFVGALPGG